MSSNRAVRIVAVCLAVTLAGAVHSWSCDQHKAAKAENKAEVAAEPAANGVAAAAATPEALPCGEHAAQAAEAKHGHGCAGKAGLKAEANGQVAAGTGCSQPCAAAAKDKKDCPHHKGATLAKAEEPVEPEKP